METFDDFGLKPQLLKAVKDQGYTVPTQIQREVWTIAAEGKDVVGQSQTGTGKTTAFLLPLLQAVNNRKREPQVLIVAPTRELVTQIRDDIMKLTKDFPVRSMVLMGGRAKRFQVEDLSYGPQLIVATPGRLIEFLEENRIDTTKITHFVLDEVDRMLDMGFIDDVDRIWSQLTDLKQTMTFSATINDDIKRVINKHCKDFIHIKVGEAITVDKIDHTYIDMALNHKFSTLNHILAADKGQKTIIFAQTKRNTEVICHALIKAGHKAQYLNGDLDQRERTRALRSFKEGSIKILVTTDVAARGLNMDKVQLVVNFEVPREPESYIHRIGRTGRAGADGKAIMFVSPDERHLVMDIERSQKIKLKKSPEHEAVADDKDEFRDVQLDRPIPPSDKKRRMLDRAMGIRTTG
jgi:ATP-dependent RNA helicase DeaD